MPFQLPPHRRIPPTSPLNSLRQRYQYHPRSSSESRGQSGDLHGGREGSTLSTIQRALPGITDQTCPGTPRLPDSSNPADFNPPGWKHLISAPLATNERISLITTIFSSRDEVEMARYLCREDAQASVDVIYEALDDLDHALRMRCMHFLCKVCGRHALLPKPLAIPVLYDKTTVPLCHGGFADVWNGTYRGLEVAVKVLKLYECNDQEEIRRRFCKEVVMWSALRHPNVLPLLGATMTGVQFAMVSEWMVNGNASEFVKAHPGADRLGLLRDVCRGLDYLHSQEMAHGDLKGANILINHEGRACVADFSLLTILPDKTYFISAISFSEGGSIRWMSPELLDPERSGFGDGRPTKESDCYALGMVIYEILSGQVPFFQDKNTIVIRKVMDGQRPLRPRGAERAWFTDDLWGMLELCWKPQPCDRPSLKTLLQRLEGTSSPLRLSSPTPTVGGSSDPTVKKLGEQPLQNLDRMVALSAPHTILSPSTSDIVLSLPNVKQLKAGNFDLDKLVARLMEALVDESQRNEIQRLTGDAAVLLVECLDKVMSSDTFRTRSDLQTRSTVFSVFSRLSRGCQYLPHSYWIDPTTITLPDEPYTSGACAEVYNGTQNGEPVAVKVLRTSNQESLMKLKKRFCKEVIVWKHVSSPYILKFNGVFYHNGVPAIVTPWMAHGNIVKYLDRHTDADRLHLLLGVVKGIAYLHNCGTAHGDIKGPNILVSDSTPPQAILADFGFVRVTTISVKGSTEEQGTVCFMAPELLFPPKFGLDKGVPSKEADVYALGMTVYQVLTGKWPFYSRREAEVMHTVVSGERPPKPSNAEEIGMSEVVWDLLRECWREDRMTRPTIAEILRKFCEIAGEHRTTNSTSEEFKTFRLNSSNRISATSECSHLTAVSSSRRWDTDRAYPVSTLTAPWSPYDIPDQEEIFEARVKVPTRDDNTVKKARPTKGAPGVRERHTSKKHITSPTDRPRASRTSRTKYIWDRVKRIAVRSTTL